MPPPPFFPKKKTNNKNYHTHIKSKSVVLGLVFQKYAEVEFKPVWHNYIKQVYNTYFISMDQTELPLNLNKIWTTSTIFF